MHNRKELLSWLDKIIEGTQKAHNFHLVSDDEDGLSASVAVTPGSPVTLPTFITTRRGLICSGKSLSPAHHQCRTARRRLVDLYVQHLILQLHAGYSSASLWP